jgi:hypothetical protein
MISPRVIRFKLRIPVIRLNFWAWGKVWHVWYFWTRGKSNFPIFHPG